MFSLTFSSVSSALNNTSMELIQDSQRLSKP